MKIDRISTVAVPSRENAGYGLRVDVVTGDGITGTSYVRSSAQASIEQLAADLLIGQDPRGTYGLWQRMSAALENKDCQGQLCAAAALDIALWDLKARINEEPLWRTVGGSRQRINAHAAGLTLDLGGEALAQRSRNFSAQFGLNDQKLDVGEDQNENLQRLELLSDVLAQSGAHHELMVRFVGRPWPSDSIISIREMEARYPLNWVEGVCSDADFPGVRRVSEQVGAAVCAGAGLRRVDEFLPLFRHYAANIIMLDPNWIGISATLQLSDAAFGLELPVILASTPGNWGAHLASAMAGLMSVEVTEPVWPESLVVSDVRVADGWCRVGDQPGLGLNPGNEAA